jgi:hypothetical protein
VRDALQFLASAVDDPKDEVGEDGVVRPDWEFFSWHDEEAAGYRCPWTINDFTLPPWVWEVLNEAA